MRLARGACYLFAMVLAKVQIDIGIGHGGDVKRYPMISRFETSGIEDGDVKRHPAIVFLQ